MIYTNNMEIGRFIWDCYLCKRVCASWRTKCKNFVRVLCSVNGFGKLISSEGEDWQVELEYVKLFEDDKGSYFGELIYDTTAYPNAVFTPYWGDDDLWRVDGTSIYLKDGYYVNADGPTIETDTNVWNFGDIKLNIVDGPMHPYYVTNGGGYHTFSNSFTSVDFYTTQVSSTPLLTLEDFSGSVFKWELSLQP